MTEEIETVKPKRINKTANKKEYFKTYYQANKDKIKTQSRAWQAAHPEIKNAWSKKYREKMKLNGQQKQAELVTVGQTAPELKGSLDNADTI